MNMGNTGYTHIENSEKALYVHRISLISVLPIIAVLGIVIFLGLFDLYIANDIFTQRKETKTNILLPITLFFQRTYFLYPN